MTDETTPRLDVVTLEAIESQANAATPAPWKHVPDHDKNYIEPPIQLPNPGDDYIASCRAGHEDGPSSLVQAHANAAFIAGARDAVPLLTAEIRRLRKVESRWQDQYQKLWAENEHLIAELQAAQAKASGLEASTTSAWRQLAAHMDTCPGQQPVPAECAKCGDNFPIDDNCQDCTYYLQWRGWVRAEDVMAKLSDIETGVLALVAMIPNEFSIKCDDCNGQGYQCLTCGGRGWVYTDDAPE